MEAKELRIGNWVKQPEGFNQVYSIDPDLIDQFQLEPIPLTEEWLMRFGSQKRGQEIHLDYFTLYDGQGSWTVNDNSAPYTIAVIEYVHQLQNLYFALTGKELEIK
jgi:hypothetical protein